MVFITGNKYPRGEIQRAKGISIPNDYPRARCPENPDKTPKIHHVQKTKAKSHCNTVTIMTSPVYVFKNSLSALIKPASSKMRTLKRVRVFGS